MTSKITIKEFGTTPDGRVVNIYVMKSNEIEVGFINYGAAIAFLKVLDSNGQLDDIVTGFDSLSGKLAMLKKVCFCAVSLSCWPAKYYSAFFQNTWIIEHILELLLEGLQIVLPKENLH